MDIKLRKLLVKRICNRLGIDIPKVIYVKGLRAAGVYNGLGQYVLIRDDMNMYETVSTIAHELKHVQQHKRYKHYMYTIVNTKDYDYYNDAYEIEAFAFEEEILKHYKLIK